MSLGSYSEAERRLWQHHGATPQEHRVHLPTLDVDVRVTEFGEGTPVLYLHGAPTSGATFVPLVARLPGVRNLVLDRPGCGLSDPLTITPDTALTVLRSLVVDTLDALGIDRAHLVASSAGSAYAMHAALAAPERVGRTIHLGSPWLVEGMPLPRLDRLLLGRRMNALVVRMTPSRKQQVKAMRDLGHGPSMDDGRVPPVYMDWYDALVRHTPTFAEMAVLPAFAQKGRRYRADLEIDAAAGSRIASPTHFLWGTEDSYGGEDVARDCVARIRGASLEVLEGAGHLPWLDEPEVVAAGVEGFLAAATVGE